MHTSFLDTGIIDLLEADPRPSFIVALTPHPPTIVYTNPAFSGYTGLLDIITAHREDNGHFWDWISGVPLDSALKGTSIVASSFAHSNIFWTRSVVHEQMVVIGANEQAPSSEPPRKVRLDVSVRGRDDSASPPRRAIPVDETMGLGNSPLPPSSARPNLAADFAAIHRAKSTPGSPPASMKQNLATPTEPVQPPQAAPRSASDLGWILSGMIPEQRPFWEVIRNVKWEATHIGPMASWPPRLEQTFNQILVDSRPIAVCWGPHYTTIYNEAFSKLCGSKHPALLGLTVEDAWPEAGHQLKEKMRAIACKQKAPEEDEWNFFIERESDVSGEPNWFEETYLKWSISPIIDSNSECVGFTHSIVDATSMRLWERRMQMLIDLGEVLVTARDVRSYWEKTIQQLGNVWPHYDIPLAILYSVEEGPDAMALAPPSCGSTKICRLAGALGVPDGHPIAPAVLSLQPGDEALSALFQKALSAHHPFLLQKQDNSLPRALLEGLQWRGFGDPCRAAVIVPIRPTKEENVMGLLLLGLNPRRPYDNDYRQYISLLSQKLTTSLASTVLLEEEARRGRNAAEEAAFDQAQLKEKLAASTREANESIQMFEAVAEFVPVGMCFGDHLGNLTFANDAWYKITGHPGPVPISNQSFLSCVKEEDRPVIISEYEKLKTVRNVEFEFRVKRLEDVDIPAPLTRNSPSFEKAGLDFHPIGDNKERHILATAEAERATDGTIIRVLTCLTDVTAHKQVAEEAVRRAQQAENLKRMTEFATVGMYDMDLDGRLLGANKVFFEMCGLPIIDPTVVVVKPWEECVWKEDYPLLKDKAERMVVEAVVQNVEVRLRTTWNAEDGAGHKVVVPRWVQATLMPVRTTEGTIASFTGCLSDVSLQRWQLEREKQRKEEAIESKRQQENFIDMTSHEMRNPLSAIIHCADAITATLTRVQELVNGEPHGDTGTAFSNGDGMSIVALREQNLDPQSEVRALVENCIDSAETIVGCAQHQKRIVDDILTMSKLDSKLLAITPITVNPIQMVQEALKMFEVEARRVDIHLSMVVDRSYRDLGIRYLDFDPSRLKQVLINLLTNALKFTKTGPTRNVSVAISASLTRPSEATSSVQFIPRSQEGDIGDCTQRDLCNRADSVFLMFEVKDTGQGLTEEEKKSLFQRFVQASSRTHVKYGGSGLGLFISRRLTELQNGAIGVASQPGVGSTFAFYIEANIPAGTSILDAEASTAAIKAAISGLQVTPSPTSSRRQHSPSTASGSTTPSSGTQRPSPITASPSSVLSPTLPPQIKGVLVVEDNLINQQITRRGLLNMGFTVDVANHGVECLDKLRRTDRFAGGCNGSAASNGGEQTFPLSIILMDIEMPIQDGLTCTRNIRELEREGKIRGGRLPIIAVSANARMEQIMEAKAAGCDDVLVKPYRMPELLEKMRIVMRTVAALEEPLCDMSTIMG
ncbi:hypothetical protein B0T25DRAFT_39636 [Lasiosphaeria hispida]|uniref:Hybrid signal transduction histidine kinase K n=1 Tax=Lasiosphaeria hispida TaxID=260671 RepID=A0AAJ0MK32_9PEZI|nr:hypothetical protein B0T25DRAFT_39636 [Lasiosphaeria hispida]